MPQAPTPPDYERQLYELQKRVRALETQQLFTVTDTHLNARVQLGLLAGSFLGDYGLLITDSLGNAGEVLPFQLGTVDTSQNTTSTVFTDLATAGPSVTVAAGAMKRILVLCFSEIGNDGGGGNDGDVGLAINGVDPAGTFNPLSVLTVFGSGSAQANVATARVYTFDNAGTPFTQGQSITFKMRYKQSTAGKQATFAARTVLAWPF